VPRPWERTDLRPLTELESGTERRIKLDAAVFLEYLIFDSYKPEAAVAASLPGTITTMTVDRIRASVTRPPNVRAVFISERGDEAVAITAEAELCAGGRAVRGRVAVTLAQDAKGGWRAKSVAVADATTLQPLVDAYYEARPDKRPKGNIKP
jgi:hypothetical protein